jgi:hypothetical protein
MKKEEEWFEPHIAIILWQFYHWYKAAFEHTTCMQRSITCCCTFKHKERVHRETTDVYETLSDFVLCKLKSTDVHLM